MLRTVIIDDESKGRKALRNLLTKYCSNVTILAEGENVKDGLEKIRDYQPNLIFLDIQMPDGTGFDLLEQVKSTDFQVIFVTAFDQYAVRAFKCSAIDYILKPIDPDQLIEAVKKVENNNRFDELEKKLEVLATNRKNVEKLAVPTSNGVRLVKIQNIVRCESESNYTTFFMESGEKIVVTKTLKEYDEILNEMRFYRVHQSHLVNLEFVDSYVNRDGGYVIMEDGSQVEISRRKKEKFLEILLK
jgi:two-component system LytT family response regulator